MITDAQNRLERLDAQLAELALSWSWRRCRRPTRRFAASPLSSPSPLSAKLSRRCPPLRQSAAADGLSWPGALGALDRRHGEARRPDVGRQSPRPPRPGGRCLELSPSGQGGGGHSRPPRGPAEGVYEIAWKAQTRLCARYWRLIAAGKKRPLSLRRSRARWRRSYGKSAIRSNRCVEMQCASSSKIRIRQARARRGRRRIGGKPAPGLPAESWAARRRDVATVGNSRPNYVAGHQPNARY